MRNLVLISFLLFAGIDCFAFDPDTIPGKKRINIVLSNNAPSPDPASISFQSQAWLNQLFNRKKMHFMIVATLDESVTRITNLLKKENALIGNIWFDSHGHMGRRVTVLELGETELNYQTIKEPWIQEKLSTIGMYCDSLSKITLGSCYSAASYYSAGNDSFPPQRMNGDSLMHEMALMMNNATIYGSVSWITTKPGIFNGGHASAGNPWAKRFRDPKFRHAWDSLGIWKSYTVKDGFKIVNTVSLDNHANIILTKKAFLDIPKNKKKQQRKIKKLKAGNFSDRYFYKFKDPLHERKRK